MTCRYAIAVRTHYGGQIDPAVFSPLNYLLFPHCITVSTPREFR